ncbi:MAG: hypothetical protein RR202_01300 [Bacteroidales bacterium]
MEKKMPEMNKKYHFRFDGVQYDIKYFDDGTMESICTAADLDHHPSRINQPKIFKINRFEIAPNIWCIYWSTPKVSMIYIEDWDKMIVNSILTMPDMKQVREAGIITILE